MQNWYAGDTVNLSIGQGALLVTPIQAVRMIAAIANGGRLVRPHLLKSIDEEEGANTQSSDHLNFKDSTMQLLRNALRNVVKDKTGCLLECEVKYVDPDGRVVPAHMDL